MNLQGCTWIKRNVFLLRHSRHLEGPSAIDVHHAKVVNTIAIPVTHHWLIALGSELHGLGFVSVELPQPRAIAEETNIRNAVFRQVSDQWNITWLTSEARHSFPCWGFADHCVSCVPNLRVITAWCCNAITIPISHQRCAT